jgi:hypothetical protein
MSASTDCSGTRPVASIDFPLPGAINAVALATNDRCEIVGAYVSGATSTLASGINNQGEIVGGYEDSRPGAARVILSKDNSLGLDASISRSQRHQHLS